ncbi:L-tryptophan decarboxylase [Apiospora phragmitis]|uniref:L-tryptophan decarboxylase n=1 Tax=Apiospora phragmitis TaxID=2905665 RepID=A0ABR1W7A8_9PEZI
MVHQHGEEHDIPDHHKVHRPGAWMPADHRLHHDWLDKQIKHVEGHGDKKPKLIPVLQEFKDLIEGDPRIYMYFSQMWEEVPHKHPYDKDPTGKKQIRDYEHMLDMLNHVFTKAPEWTDAAFGVGMVGVPMVGIFDYAMATPSGHAAFLDPEVNKMLKKVLNEWGKYLQTPDSAKVLNDKKGWFGKHARTDLMQVANGPLKTSHTFEEMYICDPSKEYMGYKSWDGKLTKTFSRGSCARACARGLARRRQCRGQRVRVQGVQCGARGEAAGPVLDQGPTLLVGDMLAHDPLSEQFDQCTVYQAFLSALSYHRWHSPVSGTIKRCFVQDGTYFSEPILETDGQTYEIDNRGISMAQGYLTALATRAVIFIEADNPAIGLMAFIGIGMDEVSTCDITVKEEQHIKKGDQTGMFHFGGSSHCLLFRKGVKVDDFPDVGREENVPVRSKVAVVKK